MTVLRPANLHDDKRTTTNVIVFTVPELAAVVVDLLVSVPSLVVAVSVDTTTFRRTSSNTRPRPKPNGHITSDPTVGVMVG